MDKYLIIIGLFILVLLLMELIYYGLRRVANPEKREVSRRLKAVSPLGLQDGTTDITRKKILSEVFWLNRLLSRFPTIEKMSRFLEQAGSKTTPGLFILLSILLGGMGYLAGIRLTAAKLGSLSPFMALLWAGLLGIVPFSYMYWKKKKRMEKFQAQLPEALDLIARSLRAGHAFSGGLKMVGDEMEDPIGPEFSRTLNEINFGVNIPDALKNLSSRTDCPDLKFFVISVIIQRETGGNLAEILGNIAHLIRERFKLQGKIRILAAPGKFSAIILIILPLLLGFAIANINPKYFHVLYTDPIGKTMILVCLLLMIAGIFVMKKMVAIRV